MGPNAVSNEEGPAALLLRNSKEGSSRDSHPHSTASTLLSPCSAVGHPGASLHWPSTRNLTLYFPWKEQATGRSEVGMNPVGAILQGSLQVKTCETHREQVQSRLKRTVHSVSSPNVWGAQRHSSCPPIKAAHNTHLNRRKRQPDSQAAGQAGRQQTTK